MTATPAGGTASGPRPVRAPRGTALTCRGWPQEAAMRMLMNNLDPEVAEHPDQLTAGSSIYIGTQGILQGTYATFAAVAATRFGGTLAGTITLTAGLGGMGGAQPLAVTMNGGVAICVDCDPSRIARRIEHGYCDVAADDADDALRRAQAAASAGQALSIGLLGNAADVLPALL